MQRTFLLALFVFSVGSTFAEIPTTKAPFTYVIDYTRLQATSPESRERLSVGTPTLYHPGSELRYMGRFGFGGMVEDYRNTPYRTYEQQVKDYLAFMRGKGVRWITPYLCNQTISGNDVHRYGAWEVYDRWEDFAFLGLGPKPRDLLHWMQREASGNLHYNYSRKCFLERHNDELQVRYAPCPNNQDWRNLCNAEARTAAGIGFDGLFIDNNIIHCYCASCQRRFQEYLKDKYGPQELYQAFGTKDYAAIGLYKEGDLRYWARTFKEFKPWLEKRHVGSERRVYFDTPGSLEEVNVDAAGGGMLVGEAAEYVKERILDKKGAAGFEVVRLANPALQTPVGRLRWAESMMFWASSIGEQLAEMRDGGREVNRAFFVVPNWGVFQRVEGAAGRAEDGKDMRRWRRGAAWQMYEEDSATGIIASGLVLDYDLELRYAFACGVQAMLLPYTLGDRDIEEVHHAETAASGGSVFVTTFRHPEVRTKYREFYEQHRDLYEGYRPAARVGLVFFFDQCHYLNIEHLRQVHALNRFLADQQISFAHVIEDDLTPERLSDFRVLVLPNLAFLSDDQINTFQGFIRRGGTVITVGEVASHDLYCRPRPGRSFAPDSVDSARLISFKSLELALPYRGVDLESGLQGVRSIPIAESINKEDNARYRMLAELDRNLGFKRYQETGPLTEAISRALGSSPHVMDPKAASGVRHTAWVKLEGNEKRLVIHLVNKNVPLAERKTKRKLQPVERLTLAVPFPDGEKVGTINVWKPGAKRKEVLRPEIKGAKLQLTIPSLGAYVLVEIISETGPRY